jgi:hypothetical protein
MENPAPLEVTLTFWATTEYSVVQSTLYIYNGN